ncbi:zinc finger domain-like protein [Angomonas deanei]|nr:zinc finger domain-like protein [Angomonas deanei]|eukprot:EPY29836.1 zinc finger domain-like protein [Angomonas deanei]
MLKYVSCKMSFFTASTLLGYIAIPLAVSLVVFCAFVTSRDVIPVITVPGTFHFYFLNFLVLFFSFNMLFNFICASTFSKRLGTGMTKGVGGWRGCLNPTTVASPETLAELERIASEGLQYNATQRRMRLLEDPKRFCLVCLRLKAPREYHCKVCGVCVCKMDHHCPFVNNCIDVENNRYFFLFIVWLGIGTFLDFTIPGYAYLTQRRYEQRVEALLYSRRGPQSVRAPYGAKGAQLTTFPVFLALVFTGTIFVCMLLFLYTGGRAMLTNTTLIEHAVVEDKIEYVYQSTQYAYRSPYDLGPWRNVIEMFRTPGDPVVSYLLQEERATPLRLQSFAQYGRLVWCRVLTVGWVALPPTLRPADHDGMHYPTFDSEIRGESEEMRLVVS